MTGGSPAQHPRATAALGVALGVAFTVCFVTGLISDLIQEPRAWLIWPARPRDLYRWTQGAHLVSGIVSIPLLLAKLFTVSRKLWVWPPARGLAHAVERLALVPLVGGSLLLLLTGLLNVFYWYPFPFSFTTTHYWTAWITVGALLVHLGAKLPVARAALRRPAAAAAAAQDAWAQDRRRFLATVGVAAGIVGVSYLGSIVSPLRALAVLAPRRSDTGPQGLPVNKTAADVKVVQAARDPAYRLQVIGAVDRPLHLGLAELRARANREADLPIACVEGWSVGARWRGVPVRALLAEAGAQPFTHVVVRSLQRQGPYAGSILNRPHAMDPDTLLALDLNGAPLHLDHGFPVRLIAPNNPGVIQTKWVGSLEVR